VIIRPVPVFSLKASGQFKKSVEMSVSQAERPSL